MALAVVNSAESTLFALGRGVTNDSIRSTRTTNGRLGIVRAVADSG